MKRVALASMALFCGSAFTMSAAAADSLDDQLDGRAAPAVSQKYSGAKAASRTDYRGDNDRSRDRSGDRRRDDVRNDRDRRGSSRYRTSDVRCVSSRSGRHHCRVNSPFREVQFVSRVGDRRCRQGRDWGYDRRGIWVENGCGAMFRVILEAQVRDYDRYDRTYDRRYDDRYDRRRADYRDTVSCYSRDYRREVCHIPRSADEVRLVKRKSNSSCYRGTDWGVGRRGIWVDNGCKAIFAYTTDRRSARYDDGRRY